MIAILGITSNFVNTYKLLVRLSIGLLCMTGLIHSLSFLSEPNASNETEQQLLNLMTTYKRDLGLGFAPTTTELFNALSSCFTLAYVLGGVVLLYLHIKTNDIKLIKGVLGIYVIAFGVSFLIMALLTFLPPIVLTGLTWAALVGAYFSANFAVRP